MTSVTYESLNIVDNTISIKELSISAGKRSLLRNANITISPDRKYGIIAKNGLGKSTLIRTIADLLVDKPLSTLFVDQYLDGDLRDVIQTESIVDVVLRANKERFVLMEKMRKLEKHIDNEETSSDALLAEYCTVQDELTAIGADKAESEVKRVLKGLGFSVTDMLRPFSEFSGGWKRRVLLARAFYIHPEILFADEITNDLDLNAILWLSNYLSEWKGTLVLISHNIAFLNTVCTDIIAFERARPPIEKFENLGDMQGTISQWGCTLQQYRGNYVRYKKMVQQKLDTALTAWNSFEKQFTDLRKAGKKTEAGALIKKRAGEGCFRPEYIKHVIVNFPEMRTLTGPIIEFIHTEYTYPDNTVPVLKDINLRINPDARYTIVGPNGAGKTTLLNLLTGVLEPTHGEIRRHRALVCHYYNQQTVELLPENKTAVEYLVETSKKSEGEVRAALGRMGLEGQTHILKMNCLSGGQRVRVAMADFQLRPAHMLVLDEVTNHLDIEAIEAIIEGINGFEGAVVIVSHDADFITETRCEILRCSDNTVIEYRGTLEDYFEEIIKDD